MSCDDIIIEVPEEVIVIEMTPEGADGKDGNGIASIELISTVGLVKTYRITFTNGTHYDYEVEDGEDGAPGPAGNGIASISLISTSGLQKTYRITFTNGGHFDYVVTDGANGAPGADGVGIVSVYKTGTSGLVDTYTILYTNGNTDEFTVTNGAAGATGNGISSVEKIGTVGLVDTYRINFTNGSHYDYTVTNGQDGADPEWGNITGNIADQTDLQNALSEKADIIHTSASGALVHITDAGAYPVDALSVGIEPIQDLHGYDAPWPAGGGKNLYVGSPSFDGFNNLSYWTVSSETYNGHEVIYKTGAWYGTSKQIQLEAGKTYTFSAMVKVSDSATVYIYNTSGSFLNSASISANTWTKISANYTASQDESSRFRVETNRESITLYLSEYQLEQGSTATAYAPYSNVCPISGHSSAVVTRTGGSLINYNTLESGGLDASGNETAVANFNRTKLTPIASDKKCFVYIPYNIATYAIRVHGYNNGTWVQQLISITSSNFQTITELTVPSSVNQIRISYPTEFVNLSLWQGTSVTIDLDGTRYGGQLNVLTGEMRVTHGIITASDMSDAYWGPTTGGLYYAQMNISLVADSQGISSMLEQKSVNSAWASTTECFAIESTRIRAYTKETTYASFAVTFADLQIVYPLATPFTVQLSPATLSLLLGENNIWSDTGSVDVGYRADTRLYIDSKLSAAIAELQALILEH